MTLTRVLNCCSTGRKDDKWKLRLKEKVKKNWPEEGWLIKRVIKIARIMIGGRSFWNALEISRTEYAEDIALLPRKMMHCMR